ncbi:EamA family transporter [Natronococcus occultus]|uniref:EamA-like family transporter n=1 Tax=Natronococcus occultus SP4 TaxID=694430 RepID=L0K0Y6_9EURY|nr:EamA family transporter [Natronococcus occultus]AGB38661.1 EamA-like family transporter [Natronococcus occultus SP4]
MDVGYGWPAPTRDRIGILLVVVSAVGFGTLGIFGLCAQQAALSIPTVLAFRFLLAAVAVWALLVRVEPLVLTAHVLPAAGIAFVTVGSLTGELAIPTAPSAWLILLWIAVLATALPVVTLFAVVKYVGASRAGIISTVEPPVTVALGAALFAEPVTTATVVGGTLVLLVVVVLERE